MPDEPIRVILENNQTWLDSPLLIILATGLVALFVPMFNAWKEKQKEIKNKKIRVYTTTVGILKQLEHYAIATNEHKYSQKYYYAKRGTAEMDYDREALTQEIFETRNRHEITRTKRVELMSELYQCVGEYEILIGENDSSIRQKVEKIRMDKAYFQIKDLVNKVSYEELMDDCRQDVENNIVPKMNAIIERMETKLNIKT